MKKFNLFNKKAKTEEVVVDSEVRRDEEGNPIMDLPEEKKKLDVKGLAIKAGLGVAGVAATGLIILKAMASTRSESDSEIVDEPWTDDETAADDIADL